MGRAGSALAVAFLGSAALCATADAVTLVPIGTATYSAPTYVTSDPRDPDRLFVTEQPGTIDVTTPSGTSLFLDLTDKVVDGGEQGLWSMAFAPDFATSGLFYVAYSAEGTEAITLDEYREQGTPDATEATRREVLAIANNTASNNHNGGQLQFGPDGYLYWSVGEDAIAPANAQDLGNLLGKILRIDPRGALPGQYTVPPDNPFVGNPPARPEIWILGLRNPWRFSFDRLTGEMFIGDVGGGSWEEVNRGTRGANYGWPICEGPCTSPHPELANPVYSYSSDDSPCNAITGGYIVRDSNLGALYGRYLFTDACTDLLRSINPAAPPPTDGDRSEGLSANAAVSLGEDACGRLYVVAQIDAQVFRVEGSAGGACPPDPPVAPDTDPPETTLELKRKGKRSTRAKFTIDSDEPGSTFECKLDKGKWKSCGERRKVKRLDTGRHKFRARATDAAGNADRSPARKRFKVKPR